MSFQSETANSGLNSIAVLIGRVFISILFILAGWAKLTAIGGTAGYFGSLGLPMPTVTAVLVGLIEFLGGLAILIGFQTRIAAVIVALFTIGAILVAHMDFSDGLNVMMAQKNLAIAGGLLALAAYGAGSYSVDAKLR
ncbi:putative oxidoreductase [Paenochrobactrum gallinarii]|uniref:Putative oxidoreductase n=1 Tax=Paenochrobactrum gallinarii TaxID=643673 RepID=A0A841M4D3_9HYPH|nr:DoxX family protein [Paenochrobactrum gallinarii]MBB6260434.1 putative oxidoreductase [Paenochrobactrum gallinarii]